MAARLDTKRRQEELRARLSIRARLSSREIPRTSGRRRPDTTRKATSGETKTRASPSGVVVRPLRASSADHRLAHIGSHHGGSISARIIMSGHGTHPFSWPCLRYAPTGSSGRVWRQKARRHSQSDRTANSLKVREAMSVLPPLSLIQFLNSWLAKHREESATSDLIDLRGVCQEFLCAESSPD